ncbi:hypothetical protein TGDOM2_244645 [Toxoplasma gondii GAB2-2007-GAL-DOM2]|uniref:Uncharacterized protein n=4 Tax=Toxoplasma gondii TaxID=5811 RepID=S7VMV5_TOXGG|nr:hypothetical protein TGGT1_244645 [Toxoplasma gondii GT1]KAF4643115.1 hypothetical protein TGRH88_027820 [Toxoplasma gondii]KFG36491.1 hypothetical protein TGDOM2_244645 [Toxoplasma gondii GAB2-2007-GAL-DOM2]KFG51647.1 hypothetical protein TGFOU_244645 [Toxoplasma gondii FOU]
MHKREAIQLDKEAKTTGSRATKGNLGLTYSRKVRRGSSSFALECFPHFPPFRSTRRWTKLDSLSRGVEFPTSSFTDSLRKSKRRTACPALPCGELWQRSRRKGVRCCPGDLCAKRVFLSIPPGLSAETLFPVALCMAFFSGSGRTPRREWRKTNVLSSAAMSEFRERPTGSSLRQTLDVFNRRLGGERKLFPREIPLLPRTHNPSTFSVCPAFPLELRDSLRIC